MKMPRTKHTCFTQYYMHFRMARLFPGCPRCDELLAQRNALASRLADRKPPAKWREDCGTPMLDES